MMAERGVIFCTEMVKAILDGRKTQTRRIIKPSVKPKTQHQIGDLLWVKETWDFRPMHGKRTSNRREGLCIIGYKADDATRALEIPASANIKVYSGWRSSRFMRKWAARIWLEVTGVKVEQLQDISEEDAIAEGMFPEGTPLLNFKNADNPVEQFAQLWDRLHPKPGERWADNRWVFVPEFKRIEKGA